MELSQEKQKQIKDLLDKIEAQNGVDIFFAVESGSRAWGFASADSDYDIRFLYHHNASWYVTAFDKKDHIDLAMLHDLDAAGWDVGKCMRLLYKGNASLHEWIQSPIVYRCDESKVQKFKALAPKVFNPAAAFYHYISLAKKKLLDEKTQTHAKSFLYGMRAALCAKFIADEATAPPILFAELCHRYLDAALTQSVNEVLEVKALGNEQDQWQIPQNLWQFVQSTYSTLNQTEIKARREGDSAAYDDVMRAILGIAD